MLSRAASETSHFGLPWPLVAPRSPLSERTCEFCSKRMQLTASALRRAKGAGRFCSMACKVAFLAAARQHVCPQCGHMRQYAPGQRIGLYCSNACRAEAQRRQADTTCAECGEPIRADPSARRRYCSQSCYHAARARTLPPRVVLACGQCGRLFAVAKGQADGGRRYCSIACRNAAWGTQLVSCRVCGQERRAWASQLAVGGGKYCSHRCQGEANRRHRALIQCERCGKGFEQRRTWRHERFCSRQCFIEAGRETRTEVRCHQCRKRTVVKASDQNRRFCSPECYRRSIAVAFINVRRAVLSTTPIHREFVATVPTIAPSVAPTEAETGAPTTIPGLAMHGSWHSKPQG